MCQCDQCANWLRRGNIPHGIGTLITLAYWHIIHRPVILFANLQIFPVK